MIKSFEFGDSNKTTPLIKIYKRKYGNINESVLYGLDFLYNYCDLLSIIGSNTTPSINWIDKLIESYNACKTNLIQF